jgi:hypothetical protein
MTGLQICNVVVARCSLAWALAVHEDLDAGNSHVRIGDPLEYRRWKPGYA